MPAGKSSSGPEDLKAKFKEALERKHGNDSGQFEEGHEREPKPHETHGPEGAKRGFTRRKTG
jgi:Family of unknown function (DUF5302)